MNDESQKYHEPVLLLQSMEGLQIRPGGVYVDATYGGGGHSRAILEKLSDGKLFAFDQDEEAKKNVVHDERLVFINQNFRHLKKMLRVHGVNKADGILADLGISSHQVDSSHRGFAHRLEGMLDMRMDQHAVKTAADLYGEEVTQNCSRRLAFSRQVHLLLINFLFRKTIPTRLTRQHGLITN